MGVSLRLRSSVRAACIACSTLSAVACGNEKIEQPAFDAAPDDDASHSPGCPTNTGFAGDELCLEPPAPSEGIQLHYGPSNYDDPDELARFLVRPNESVTDCFFLKTPNDTDMPVGELHIRMRPDPGSTLILYTELPDHADGLGICDSATQGNFWAGSRAQVFDFPTPGAAVPENAGLAKHLPARTQTAINLHFENAGSESILREAWANLVWHDPNTVTGGLGSIFLLAGLTMNVMPGTTALIRGSAPITQDLKARRVALMLGHFHTHTTRFTAWKAVGNAVGDAGGSQLSDAGSSQSDSGPSQSLDAGDAADALVPVQPTDWGTGTRTILIAAYDWSDPGYRYFDSVHKNPLPDPTTKQGGSVSGPVELNVGDRIDWECEVHNDLTTPLTFSNELRTGEMCNVFGIYVPDDHALDPPTWTAVW